MTCRDFDLLWQELFDGRASAPALERTLDEHAASCAVCRAAASRYQTLRYALRNWGPVPAAPANLVKRILAGYEAERADPRIYRFPTLARWVAAAAVLVAATLALLPSVRPPGKVPAPAGPAEPRVAARSLGDALSDATSATLDLARVTSAPAARVGRRVLDATEVPEPSWPPAVETRPATAVLQSVGDRVGAGVRPLSGSARQAFSFLLPTTRDRKPPPPGTGA